MRERPPLRRWPLNSSPAIFDKRLRYRSVASSIMLNFVPVWEDNVKAMKPFISVLTILMTIGIVTSMSAGTTKRDSFPAHGLFDKSIGKDIAKMKKSIKSSLALTSAEDVCLSQTSLACEDACMAAEQQCNAFFGAIFSDFVCDANEPGNSTATCEIVD